MKHGHFQDSEKNSQIVNKLTIFFFMSTTRLRLVVGNLIPFNIALDLIAEVIN
jgi:hypothetical protein